MNKKISQFDLTTSLGDNDLITLIQDGENKNITKATLEHELADTFVADSELEDQITDLTNNLDALEKKHDEAIDDITDVVQDWTDEISTRPTAEQLQDVLNRVIISENKITKLAEAIANGEGGGGSSDSDIVGPHSQSTATIFPLTGYVKDVNADPLDSSDTLNEALSKLENKIDNIAASGGTGGGLNMPLIKTGDTTNAARNDSALFTAGAVDERYLNASGDTATGRIDFIQGLRGGKVFRSGWDGEGASLYPIESKWNLEIDNLFVRGNLEVNELTINEIKAVGGEILVTIADIKCTEVEETSNGWKCYFDNTDKINGFVPLDQAICQQYDGPTTTEAVNEQGNKIRLVRRYWRTVLETGDNYIVLSKTSCEPDSAIPMAGDNILQLGHRIDLSMTDEEVSARRNAIFISAKGSNSPRISFYKNIDDFTLVGKETTVIGTDSKFVGTFTQVSSNGDLIRVPMYRGYWSPTAIYNYYDQVSHNGSLWICMENNVTSEPSATNPQWYLQVEKGEAGMNGSDTAKFIEIAGNRLFLYDTPDYSGNPNPSEIILLVKPYGLSDSTTYTWTLLGNVPVTLGTGTTLTIKHTDFSTRTATIRCTAIDPEYGTFTDDFQVAKLSNGAEGLDAYYIDLSNSSVSVPFDSSGNTPLINLSDVFTEVYAYHGINPIEIASITLNTISGTATATVSGNIVRLVTFTSASAIIRVAVTLIDGVTITKDWHICRIHNGVDGYNGADAAYVMVAGEQIFKYVQGSSTEFIPSTITLAAKTYNIEYPQYKWYWAIPGSNEWVEISGQNSDSLLVNPNSSYFLNINELTFKCEVISVNGGSTYYDMMTINKLSDGVDGVGSYRGVLTNEMHTVASTYFGDVSDIELAKAFTDVQLYFQNERLSNVDFNWTVTSLVDADSTYWEADYDNYRLKLISFPLDTVLLRVHFLVEGKEVDACDFTVTKAKAGPPGDFEVSVYAAVASETTSLAAPTFSEIPSSSGTVGPDGTNWFVDIPIASSKVIWRSVGLFDGATTKLKEGTTWTTPVIFQGVNGKPGADGKDGKAGQDGQDGKNGPALNFRGQYNSGSTYHRTTYIVDVVRTGSSGSYSYWMVSEGYTSTSDAPSDSSSAWQSISSFQAVATNLLLAEKATIAGWVFQPSGYLTSQNGYVCLNGNHNNSVATIAIGQNNTGWTGTAINAGADLVIYQSGTIQLGGGTCGISGVTDAAVTGGYTRFWAGSGRNNGTDNSFYVTDAGYLYAKNAMITGTIQSKTSGARVMINSNNAYLDALDSSGVSKGRLGYDSENGYVSLELGTRLSANNTCTISTAGIFYRGYSSAGFTVGSTTSGTLSLFMSGLPTSSSQPDQIYRDSNGFLRIKV